MAFRNGFLDPLHLKAFSDHHFVLLRLVSRFSPVPCLAFHAQCASRINCRLARTRSTAVAPNELQGEEASSSGSSVGREFAWRDTLDKNGRLRSPRAARELALCVLYAGLVSERKPMRIFKQRLKQGSGDFSLEVLTRYSHLPEDEDCIFVDDAGTARQLEQKQDEESLLEAAVLTAPLPLVYNKFVLNMAENIIQSTDDSWSQHQVILDSLLPKSWKAKREGIMIPLCILHMAMAEITNLRTSSAIVIDEAVELTKRFSDIHAARVINGCLGMFVNHANSQKTQLTDKDGDLLNTEM